MNRTGRISQRRSVLALSLAVPLAALGGCRRTRSEEPPPPPLPAQVAPTPRLDVGAPPAPPAPVVAPAPPVADASAPAGPVVDLLRASEASVRVSSAVDNANDRPEKLVDGDLTTAWSSATGEMERTWIEVTLPPDARVDHLEMTAGYTREGGRRDLFTGNVRVSRVRVLREGVEVGAFALDPESRELQRVPAAGAGGVWRIETVGLVPGTQRSWREVTVSELRVMGSVGSSGVRAAPAAPPVTVGAAAAGGAVAGGDSGAIDAALTAARRDLLGEGANPESGETGCSGSYAEHCVRDHWMSIADAAVAYAATLGGAAVAGPRSRYDAHRRSLSRLQERLSSAIDRDRGVERANAAAEDALDTLMEDAQAVFAACPSPGGLTALGERLRAHSATQLRGYRFRP